ncbi:MAG: extracellular solute-binding protein [Sedimentibacter sp.]|uniref:extracellular solute-binding protein n=1 Tax=Sedimentibacter sp. TaxID=1960295 RepID=UPI002982569C|nr:extracellular solute-binding protein [Sedimentibacter sp.]MDW5299127.1 extracellular solute-binding protein [Sedimentibacter sp.]
MKKNLFLVMLLVLALSVFGCQAKQAEVPAQVETQAEEPEVPAQETESDKPAELSGEVVVYHAGSLSIPFEEVEKQFEAKYPGVDVVRTSGGSSELARKIIEFEDAVDVFASADYNVINSLLIPNYASWNALFAKNSMVIMYSKDSNYADEITDENWYEIIQRDGVNFGHSDPNLDPCGYRAVLMFQLAEKYYEVEGLNDAILSVRQEKNIRPKSVELIALLETGALDYAFEYESVAMQHMKMNPDLDYVELPVEINMSSIEFEDSYAQSSIDLNGKDPGSTITRIGEPIVYSLTIPTTAKNVEAAEEFVKLLLDEEAGMKILLESGQPVVDEITVLGGETLPESLQYLNK